MRNRIVHNLSGWFQDHSRTLPWRSNPDPYWVWLSEIMLQQTQVATVMPYFDRFITRFATVVDLAKAPDAEVMKLWAGLGYYSRARNLHKGAKAITEGIESGHGFPKDREAWLAIPGVGEYTAGAVTSIALNQREAIVDGNVERVLSRLNAWKKRDAKKEKVWAEARALVNEKNAEPRILNQALMELGALICRPKSPKCGECPVAKDCLGKKNPEAYPEPKAKVVWKTVLESKWILLRESKASGVEVYLEQNADGAWRKGLWDFPEAATKKDPPKSELWDQFTSKYVVTNHKITREHRVLFLKGAKGVGKGEWFSLDDLPGLPAPVAKALIKVQSKELTLF